MSSRTLSFAAAAAAVLVLGDLQAQTLQVRLDHSPIHADETVRLILEADTRISGARPDLTPLRNEFEVLGQSASTHLAIENGASSVRTEWIVELAPRRPGRFTIGPLTVGTMTSPTIEIEVLPASSTAVRPVRDVFIEWDVSPREVYVQSQLVCVLRIYRAAEFLEAKLSDFDPEGAVTYQLGKDATYAKDIDGRRYRVIERRFAVFPQASGRLTLPAIRLDARVAEAGAASTMGRLFGDGRRMRVATQPVEVVVKSRPDVAASPWLPAHAVTLTEEWPEEPPRLVAGEPVTWTLRLGATGLTGEQLPPIEPPDLEGIRIYPDQPSIATRADANAVHGERVQRIAMVPGTAGELKIPELKVEWWDVEADAPRTALIPARTIPVAPASAEASRRVLAAPPPAVSEANPRLWQGISVVLAVVWLVTLGTLLRSPGRRRAAPRLPLQFEKPPRDTAAPRRRVLDACRDASPRAVRDALLGWAGLAWPESPPRDLIALAARVHDEPFREGILDLDRALWSARGTGWTGRSLAARLPRELGSLPPRRRAAAARLPSLHPT